MKRYKIELLGFDEALIQVIFIEAIDADDASKKSLPFARQFGATYTSVPREVKDEALELISRAIDHIEWLTESHRRQSTKDFLSELDDYLKANE